MKVAVIPWEEYFNNNLFDISNQKLNRDNSLMPFVCWRNVAQEKGIEINTIDMYKNIAEADYFVFFTYNKKEYKKIRRINKENKTIYIAFEPPVVDKNHSERGINKLKKYFMYILTWDSDLVDEKRIFKFCYPYYWEDNYSDKISFENKKLLVNISGNKHSHHKKELYSERRKVIDYFEKNDREDFDLYGMGWEKENLKCYKGQVKRKSDIYNKYKFALCLENMGDVKGYVTEKILDCFSAGIVPIYQGASDIEDYVVKGSYIDYSQFNSTEELLHYLKNMDEETYGSFIKKGREFCDSENKKIFTGENFANTINKIIL